MKVLAISGSARKGGNTAQLLTMVLDGLTAEGVETELFELAGRPIQGCIACYKCFEQKDGKCAVDDDVVNECLSRMRAADAIILGSPDIFCRCLGWHEGLN